MYSRSSGNECEHQVEHQGQGDLQHQRQPQKGRRDLHSRDSNNDAARWKKPVKNPTIRVAVVETANDSIVIRELLTWAAEAQADD